MITCKNVSYENDSTKNLKNVTFSLQSGQVGVLIGLKGCGKSTLLKCIGKAMDFDGSIKVEDKCRYLNELPAFCENLTGMEYVEMLLTLGGNKTNELVNTLIDSIGIRPDLHHAIRDVSLYTRKVLLLLSAICLDSDTILLDEPFNGLDRNSQLLVVKLIKLLKEENKTILVSTNLIYFGFEIADELFILHRGKIKTIKNIFQNALQYENRIMPLLFK